MAQTPPNGKSSKRLVEGNKLRCPRCEKLGDPFRDFQPLKYVDEYRRELNRVIKHRKDLGGCGHVFSPGDPWIIEEYLAGNLLPKELLDQARVRIQQLEGELLEIQTQTGMVVKS